MKKVILLAFIGISAIDTFSQIDKGKVIISIQGNYVKSSTSTGGITNQNVTSGKYVSLGASFGSFISERFKIAFGLDYNWDKELRLSSLFIRPSAAEEQMEIKSSALLPNINFGYYYPVINKLYVSANLKFSYGKIKVDYNSMYMVSQSNPSPVLSDPTSDPTNYFAVSTQTSKYDFFNTGINPELVWFISEKIGLSLGLGGIEYSITDWKNDNSTWSVNFNPTYWELGVKVKL